MKINYDENKCVRCCACATECENGGIMYQRDKIVVNVNSNEDWASIVAICPTGAISIENTTQTKRGAQDVRPNPPRM